LPGDLKPVTRRQYAQLMSKVLKLAVYPCKLIATSPLPHGFLPKVKGQKVASYLYPAEDSRLLACQQIPLQRRLLWGFLAREGMRIGEAQALQWADVDLERGAVRLDRNKSDDPRAWALDAGVTACLRRWRRSDQPDTALVFPVMSDHMAELFRADLQLAGVHRAELFERSTSRMPI